MTVEKGNGCFNTASGKYYCNGRMFKKEMTEMMSGNVSIPQAVSTIAIFDHEYALGEDTYVVSIPQAVSTIAMVVVMATVLFVGMFTWVSIPQAVSTIAISGSLCTRLPCHCTKFQYRKR